MAVKIGHSSKDENGKISGGVAGDQTGKEVCIRNWYNGEWDFVARFKDRSKAEKAAQACEDACGNPNVGYDQFQRNSLRAEAKRVNYQLDKIGMPCESDCSAFMGVCVEAAGIRLPEGNGPTTGTLRRVLEATGEFEILTDAKYLTSDQYIQRADILCNEGVHTVMVLENGSKVNHEVVVSKMEPPTIYNSVRLPRLVKGSKGDAVKNLQHLLLAHGEKLPKYGADADFGDETGDALEAFQKKNGLEGDRVCGSATWTSIITK
jgi:hypothetical protein